MKDFLVEFLPPLDKFTSSLLAVYISGRGRETENNVQISYNTGDLHRLEAIQENETKLSGN